MLDLPVDCRGDRVVKLSYLWYRLRPPSLVRVVSENLALGPADAGQDVQLHDDPTGACPWLELDESYQGCMMELIEQSFCTVVAQQ